MNSTGVIDKFNGWLDVVLREEKLTGMDKAILAAVAVFYTRNGEPSFAVRQSTLADRCGTTERSVRRAFCAATDLGYLLLVEERQRGRGHRGGDRYALSLPERPDTCVRYSGGEIPDTCAEITGHMCPERPDKTDTKNGVSHAETQTPRVSYGFKTGTAPPPKRCQEHLHHPNPPGCGPCKQARENAERWEAERAEWMRGEAEQRRAAIAGCDLCDEYGDLLGADGVTTDPVIRCRHVATAPRAEAST
ncbi:hypothetical protein ACRDU6_27425 [Mycolicibacterium sp. ELW1]|uniref:hypothetical protein n=1 Tax=unclassified Mycolicibacterium TaxID=2636767 RepID=UPI003D76D4A9